MNAAKPIRPGRRRRAAFLGAAALLAGALVPAIATQAAAPPSPPAAVDLDYWEYQSLVQAGARLDHLAVIDPPPGVVGLYLAIGDRYGLLRLLHLTDGSAREIWKSKQLNGIVEEVIAADLDDDGKDELLARTSAPTLYVWGGGDLAPRYESLAADFQKIHAFTVGNVDDDAQLELIVNADRLLVYIDGKNFNREWSSLREYEATRIACGDVDGDRRPEIVLNTGQVVDSRSGEVEWADEVFGARIDLVDVDGDGVPEVLTESDGTALRIYDVDVRKEKHLQ